MIPQWAYATCEECGGIVSWSRRKGDSSDPIDERSHSATARFWHTECADVDFRQRMAREDEMEKIYGTP